jgi:hypothetical protein
LIAKTGILKAITPLVVIVPPVRPVPAVTEVTVPPEPTRFSTPPSETDPPPEIPPEVLIVMLELSRLAFGIPVGKSATTRVRKVGTPAMPFGDA